MIFSKPYKFAPCTRVKKTHLAPFSVGLTSNETFGWFLNYVSWDNRFNFFMDPPKGAFRVSSGIWPQQNVLLVLNIILCTAGISLLLRVIVHFGYWLLCWSSASKFASKKRMFVWSSSRKKNIQLVYQLFTHRLQTLPFAGLYSNVASMRHWR